MQDEMTVYIPANGYTAFLGERDCIEVWNGDAWLFSLPPGFPEAQVPLVCQVWESAVAFGKQRVCEQLERDLVRVVGEQ